MERILLKSKIHRATVTDADLDYEGSISIDDHLLIAADIREFEQVQVYNISNGHRFTTYALRAPAGSGEIRVNGAAAHLAKRDDLVIVASYAAFAEAEAEGFAPRLVYVDEANRRVPARAEATSPAP